VRLRRSTIRGRKLCTRSYCRAFYRSRACFAIAFAISSCASVQAAAWYALQYTVREHTLHNKSHRVDRTEYSFNKLESEFNNHCCDSQMWFQLDVVCELHLSRWRTEAADSASSIDIQSTYPPGEQLLCPNTASIVIWKNSARRENTVIDDADHDSYSNTRWNRVPQQQLPHARYCNQKSLSA
jgi:hypothetical protein